MNPLKILGIDKDRLKKIPKAKRSDFLSSYVRLLSKIYHPDAGGAREDFQEVQEAWEEASLSDAELNACIEQFLKAGRSKKADELESALLQERKLNEVLMENMKKWWLTHAFSDSSQELSVFNLPIGTRVLVIDIYRSAMIPMWGRASSQSRSGSNFEYQLTQTGLLKQAFAVVEFKVSDGIPEFEPGYGNINDDKGWHLVKKGKPTEISMRLIGSLDKTESTEKDSKPKRVLRGLTGPEIGEQMNSGLDWHEFQEQITKMTPRVAKFNSLIANDGENFHVLGNIIQISLP